jgi:hypothetical protein
MLDDIDYSGLTATSTNAAPTSEPKKKSNISDRSVVKKQDKPVRKPVDVESLADKAKDIETDLGAPQIPDVLAQYGLPALGALGALGTAYGVYKSMQNKAPTPDMPMAPAPAAGPDYSAYNSPAYLRNAPVPPVAPVEAAPAPQAVAPAPDRLQQAQQLAEANRQLGIGNQPTLPAVPTQFSPVGAPAGDIPPAPPYQPVGAPISAAPDGAPGPTSSASPGSSATTAIVDEVKDMIQKTPDSNTGVTSQTAPQTTTKPVPPVYPKAGTKFKTEADIPPGFVARYDVGNLDRSMGNILGLEHRANARDLFNQGKPFGQSANLNQDVSDLTKRYFQQLQSEIPETILGREARQAQKIPSEFGVFAKNTPFGTGVTVAGKAATLFALPHIANAAQQGNYGSAALQAADIATDYLPFVGQVKQALSPSSAGEGSTLSPQIVAQQKAYMDNLYRLGGGPLANTEAGERFRRNEEMTRRIAGRTGAAVPPQYRR